MDFEGATLHFHMQCFDGVVSAVIARAYLTGRERWPEPTLIPVTYTVQQDWLKRAFGPRTAIVDFLFHPEATFWVDHHETAFVGAPPQRMEPLWFYDAKADSCAGLLARVLPERGFDPQRFSELISWSERIDAARYASPEEAIFPWSPALVVNASLTAASAEDCIELVRFLSGGSLAEAARLDSVSARARELQRRVEAGLTLVQRAIRLEQGVAEFVVDAPDDAVVHRYAPYLFAREARYSVGLIRSPDRIRLSVMRNPWREFQSIHLGRLCARFGGGGHERVGSATFPPTDSRWAMEAMEQVRKAVVAHSA